MLGFLSGELILSAEATFTFILLFLSNLARRLLRITLHGFF
mgnify:CR=1 FL=1